MIFFQGKFLTNIDNTFKKTRKYKQMVQIWIFCTWTLVLFMVKLTLYGWPHQTSLSLTWNPIPWLWALSMEHPGGSVNINQPPLNIIRGPRIGCLCKTSSPLSTLLTKKYEVSRNKLSFIYKNKGAAIEKPLFVHPKKYSAFHVLLCFTSPQNIRNFCKFNFFGRRL